MRFVFWDTNFFQTLKGDGACDLSFGIRVSAKILRGTGLAICLLGYEFPCSVFVRYKQYVDSVAAPSHQILTRKNLNTGEPPGFKLFNSRPRASPPDPLPQDLNYLNYLNYLIPGPN